MASSLEQFQRTHDRAWSQIVGSAHFLNAINEARKDKGEKKYDYDDLEAVSDMARFGIVLAVAAMDDYFTRKYAEILVKSLKKNGVTHAFSKMLEAAGLDLAGALDLLQMQKPYSRIRKIAQDYYSGHVTQSENRIDTLFETLGIKGLCAHAQSRSRKKALLTSINILVKRRHKIVHAGDMSRTGVIAKIDMRTVKRIVHVKIFVVNADKHIESYLKQKKKLTKKSKRLA